MLFSGNRQFYIARFKLLIKKIRSEYKPGYVACVLSRKRDAQRRPSFIWLPCGSGEQSTPRQWTSSP